ncbi:hypothetical protein [Saccharopolyspora spinosa]|uniref:Uncharacterized protein n=1 Tax=Saccharopolyspora spinosa TaxID=60894 RepID=A0A2N3XZ58_SACSN|nr:hypothetical protein [Saccharopolyspora spinosa]PKW15948.1 hypothetical protein A8926_3730 [Saccharopolyspora spinosa]
MKIRLTGTRSENQITTAALAELLPTITAPVQYRIREISDFYPNRSNSELGRVYVDLDIAGSVPDGPLSIERR